MSDVLQACSHPVRLRVLLILTRGEQCVAELNELTETSQANLSQHLSLMRDTGLISCRRDGPYVHYRLADDGGHELVQHLHRIFTTTPA